MSLKAVCRLCLAMDAPMHDIVDSPLQSVYEKLTDISLNAAHRPNVACYLCYSQLRKSHNLMVRSLMADKVLTQLLRSGEVDNLQSIGIKNREIRELNSLIVSPVQLIVIAGPGHSSIDANVKEEPLSPQCKEEIDTDRQRLKDYFTFEEDFDRVLQQDKENIENNDSIDREEINEQLEDAAHIKQEKPEEMETYLQRCIGYMKFENSDGEDDYEKIKMTGEESIKSEQPLSSTELMETDSQSCIGYLLFGDSEYGENIDGMFLTDMENVEKKEFTDGQEIEDEELREAVKAEIIEADSMTSCYICRDASHIASDCPKRYTKKVVNAACSKQVNLFSETACGTLEPSGAALAVKCKQTHGGKIQDGSTLTPGTKNILEKPRTRSAVVEEATSRNIGRLRGTKTANNRQASTNSYSDTAIYKSNISIGSDNDDCGNVFDEKHLLIERIVAVKKTRHPKSPQQRTISRKQRLNRTGVVDERTGTHRGKKIFECEICKVIFTWKGELKKHSRSHADEKPYECDICKVRFGYKNTLQIHLRIHTGEKPYKCEICNRGFIRKSNLDVHSAVHAVEKRYECDICKVKFGLKQYLQNHLRIHTGEKPYECQICKLKFRQKTTLKIHERIHTGEKLYECGICEIRFAHKSTLQNHLKIHTGKMFTNMSRIKLNLV